MSTNLKEKVSALHDNEASELELRQILKAIEAGDGALLDQWQQLCQTQDKLDGFDVQIDIANEVQQAIEDDGQSTPVVKKRNGFSWLASAATISAVALAVVLVGNQTLTPNNEFVAQNQPVSENQLAAQQRLQSYVQQHAQQASFNGGNAVVGEAVEQDEE